MHENRTAVGRPKAVGTEKTYFRSRLRSLGYEAYADYLKSAHWRSTRSTYYADETTPKACLCGETEGLHLHHLTYERLGAERPEDLHPLCPDCHLDVHRLARVGLMDIRLQGYVSDLRRSKYARERREQLRRAGVPEEDWPETPFDPDAWRLNAERRWRHERLAAQTPEESRAELRAFKKHLRVASP